MDFVDILDYNYLMYEDIYESRDKSRLDLLRAIGDLSRRNQAASDRFDEAMTEFMGINRTDARCLDVVERLRRVSAGQLASESGLTTGAVTAVIDRLERAGYAARVRDEQDRRKVWVECTPHTRTIVKQVYGFYDIIGPVMTGRFNDEQLRGILAFLEIGRVVQMEMAAAIHAHQPGPGAPAERRADCARAFRRAMDAAAPALQARLDAIPVGKG